MLINFVKQSFSKNSKLTNMVKSHIRYLEPNNLRDIMYDESLKAG
jgi:hypothetical protein